MIRPAPKKVVARRLKKLRIRHKLTQVQVAAIAKCQQPTVCSWEAGKFRPSFDALVRLSRFYKVPVEDLAYVGSSEKAAPAA